MSHLESPRVESPRVELPGAAAQAALRTLSIALISTLIALVALWQLSAHLSAWRVLLAVVFTLPLWAPLRGLVRRNRRTYAWATLCVIPYFILGLTETVANPSARIWSGTCLGLSLVLFATLIGYLRATRNQESGA